MNLHEIKVQFPDLWWAPPALLQKYTWQTNLERTLNFRLWWCECRTCFAANGNDYTHLMRRGTEKGPGILCQHCATNSHPVRP